MTMHHIKRYLLIVSLFCLIFSSIPFYCSSISDTDKILNNSYNSLINIQKQLQLISKNSYINIVNNLPNDNNLKQLDVFSNQLNNIRRDLLNLNVQNNDFSKKSRLASLITVSSYLQYIDEKTHEYTLSDDPSNQYDILGSIFVVNSLINQIFSYTPS